MSTKYLLNYPSTQWNRMREYLPPMSSHGGRLRPPTRSLLLASCNKLDLEVEISRNRQNPPLGPRRWSTGVGGRRPSEQDRPLVASCSPCHFVWACSLRLGLVPRVCQGQERSKYMCTLQKIWRGMESLNVTGTYSTRGGPPSEPANLVLSDQVRSRSGT